MTEILQKHFEVHVKKIHSQDLKITPDTQLILYGLYQQSLYGDNTKSEPWCCNTQKLLRHQAWKKYNGMSTQEAKVHYIKVVQMIISHNNTLKGGIKDKKFAF